MGQFYTTLTRQIVTFMWGLISVTLGLIAGLIAGLVTKFLFILCFNRPLPPWGWRSNVLVESVLLTVLSLFVCRVLRASREVRFGVTLAGAIVVVLAITGNGPVVHGLMNFTYFLVPCVVGAGSAIFSMRLLRRGRAATGCPSDRIDSVFGPQFEAETMK